MLSFAYTPSKHYQVANRQPSDITLVVIHTAECAEVSSAAENLASYATSPDRAKASWHYAVDNNSITQSVLEKDIAWHAGPVNGYSVGINVLMYTMTH